MKGTTILNKTDQRKAVNRTFSLVRNGDSITSARKIVAKELKLSPNTLWVWQNKFNMVTPNTTKRTSLVSSNNTIANAPSSNIIHGLNSVKNELGNVFKSLVTKDGRFTTREASAISQVSSNILGFAKHELEVHKYADRVHRRDDATVQNLLT